MGGVSCPLGRGDPVWCRLLHRWWWWWVELSVVELPGNVVFDAVVQSQVVEVILVFHGAPLNRTLPRGLGGKVAVELLFKVAHGQMTHKDPLRRVSNCKITRPNQK